MRERGTLGTIVSAGHNVFSRNINTGQQTPYGYHSASWRPEINQIIDDPKTRYMNYREGVRKRVVKPCSHHVQSTVVDCSPSWYRTGSVNESFTSGGILLKAEFGQTSDYASTGLAALLSKCGSAVDQGHYTRWQATKPTMSTRANLAVFLAELRDLKRMFDIFPSKHFRCNNWREVIRYGNSQHLNYNFGWKPFLKDLYRFKKAYDDFDRRLHKFLAYANTDLRRRKVDTSIVAGESLTLFSGGYWRKRERWNYQVTRASLFDYTYSIPNYGYDELRWRAWADSFGMDINAANLWAIMPWSFVADWFINIGGYLDTYSDDWVQPEVIWHQCCYSRKLTGSWIVTVKGSDTYGGVEFPGINCQFSLYHRGVGLPAFSAATDDLNADKIRLGISLVLGRLL